MWSATSDLSCALGHAFYERLSAILAEVGFDRDFESLFEKFRSSRRCRPTISPGTCMRMFWLAFSVAWIRGAGLPGAAQLHWLRPVAGNAGSF